MKYLKFVEKRRRCKIPKAATRRVPNRHLSLATPLKQFADNRQGLQFRKIRYM